MTTEAQKEATKRWTERNRAKQRIYQNRSAARRFIREMADLEDLKELKGLISTREQELLGKKEKNN
ncbi:hypothetical protein [Lactobacillus delbrueckii]|uniref:hypothetical protein n=1 Tax=Lactobacillus delbrueckii TaxID=1584 RepID=UPI001E48C874|nr:hypothetical protein [Lactobacillus delbrueckii]MCD5445455.1 hypothetical protein [Lactobacillus delbrueckii subsp. lactis]